MNFFTRFHEFFEDNSGGLSASRLNLLIWSVGTFVIWAITSVKMVTLASIPESVIVMLGVVTTGKVVQRFGEKSETSS